MKKFLLLAMTAVLAASCQESIEDRAAREAREFTRKNCPMRISDVVTTDSLVFDKDTKTLHYYMSLKGDADTTALLKDNIRKSMVEGVKGNTETRPYKDAEFNFQYTYYSTKHNGQILCDVKITPKDYKQK